MEVCGTHTMAIARSGIKKMLPDTVRLISGPGCPVCVTPQAEIDRALALAGNRDVIMTTFGDMLRVPGTRTSLERLKKEGADVRIVYSCLDALAIAQKHPDKQVVFMGVGFETTTPTVAASVLEAKKRKLDNFSILSNFKLLFPALRALVSSREIRVDGFICPGHVSVITGTAPYEVFARRYGKPCVITGFEDIDIIKGITRLVRAVRERRHDVEIEYTRAVTKKGNRQARKVMEAVLEVRDSEWRGLGVIRRSGLRLRREFGAFDAERRFDYTPPRSRKATGCICGKVLQGSKTPEACRLFGRRCTPRDPVGPCMVSSEGTCAAHYKYRS